MNDQQYTEETQANLRYLVQESEQSILDLLDSNHDINTQAWHDQAIKLFTGLQVEAQKITLLEAE